MLYQGCSQSGALRLQVDIGQGCDVMRTSNHIPRASSLAKPTGKLASSQVDVRKRKISQLSDFNQQLYACVLVMREAVDHPTLDRPFKVSR